MLLEQQKRDEQKRKEEAALAQKKLADEKASRPLPPVTRLPGPTLHVDMPPPNYDGILIPLLKPQFPAQDRKQPGMRVEKLKAFLGKYHADDAQRLLARLKDRRHGDKVSEYFHDHLSTPSRTALLKILENAPY